MKKFLLINCLAIMPVLLLTLGCGPSKPEGFPDSLQPCQIEVKNGGAPEPDVTISLVGQGTFRITGTTDANGVAVMSTAMGDYEKKGVPEGEFDATLTKIVDVPHDLSPEEQGKLDSAAAEEYQAQYIAKVEAARSAVPAVLASPESPLKFTVQSGDNKLSVELNDYRE